MTNLKCGPTHERAARLGCCTPHTVRVKTEPHTRKKPVNTSQCMHAHSSSTLRRVCVRACVCAGCVRASTVGSGGGHYGMPPLLHSPLLVVHPPGTLPLPSSPRRHHHRHRHNHRSGDRHRHGQRPRQQTQTPTPTQKQSKHIHFCNSLTCSGDCYVIAM